MSSNPSLDRAVFHANTFLETLKKRPVHSTTSFDDLRHRLGRELSHHGVNETQVIDELVADVDGGLLASAGGRFFGWVIGGTIPSAAAADWLTSIWDQNAAASACSPATAVVEEVCGAWLKDLLNIPSPASFGFVTGCQAAHTTALAAARHKLLSEQKWDVERKGLSGAPSIRLVTSENRHESLIRSMRLLGLGSNSVETVSCDPSGSVSLSALDLALSKNPGQPTIVCLQAGDLNTGAFDNFKEAIPLAKAQNAWVHVDGAFGLWAASSKKHRHLLEGAELADSWATDGHKWLNLPFDSGFVFVADPSTHSAALTQSTSYSIPIEGVRNPMDWNLEWSRRARGYPVYAALRTLGRNGLEDLVNKSCLYADRLVTGISKLNDPRQSRGLKRVSPLKGQIGNR
ncbi:pyridoxal phosphate-dependent decarboxylase family protein [Kiloniella sp.]|uniref:pyridoxal phosphate-dependent decarboxylase family protein n=1 Tax=Kiloniella sp. TaxID=1938587 RepID=UPI003B011A0D